MPKFSDKPLKPNPFKTYRDPDTGLWEVIPPDSVAHQFPLLNSDNQPAPTLQKIKNLIRLV